MTKDSVQVNFEITKKVTGKLASDGYAVYTLVNLKTQRAEKIPDWIAEKYAI